MRELAEQANAWPFVEARKVLKRVGGKTPEKGYVLFETGYGPSGLPHIGTFAEVLRTTMVRRAFEQLSDLPAEIALDGVLVQKMAAKGIEMIAGIARDETFGPLVMVGFGGSDVEIEPDVAWAPAPFGEARAHALIGSLKAFARLDGGVRARRADIGALAGLLVRLSLFAESNRHRIQELDLNPVVLYEEGEGLMALDALIVTQGDNGE